MLADGVHGGAGDAMLEVLADESLGDGANIRLELALEVATVPANGGIDAAAEVGQGEVDPSRQVTPGHATLPEQVTHEGAMEAQIDASQIRQVLWNLLRNAAEASDETQGIELGVRADEYQIVLEVRDRGEGIDAEAQERLFEPFVTTKANGTGLGLALVPAK